MKLKKKTDNCSANIISSQLQNIENCFPNCYIFVIVDGFILLAKQKDNMHAKNMTKNCEVKRERERERQRERERRRELKKMRGWTTSDVKR